MNKSSKLLYDFICYYKSFTVNRRGCLSTARSKELQYLLKKNLIKMKRLPNGFSKSRYTVVVPTNNITIKNIFCPDCKNELPVKEGYRILYHNTNNTDYHKYNCSLRVDHYRDRYNLSNKKIIVSKL